MSSPASGYNRTGMSYQVLARKYRPQRFSDVIGQEHVTRTLKNAIAQERVAHGYIFSGHRGIGKTTVARILAMALNCRSSEQPVQEPCGVCESCTEIRAGNSVDVIEIDAATNRGIDEIRELREAARYRPARDRFKIWILDEAHQITDAAFNALLKTLEEPPSHVIFMLATTQPEDIPQTIRSRCQHFSFHAVRFDEIVSQLRAIATQEGIQADDNALAMLAEAGDGSMRDALSIMDQAISSAEGRLTADSVRRLVGAVPSEVLEQMMLAVQRESSQEVVCQVDKLLSEGHNPAHFARQLVRFLRNAIVAKVSGAESAVLQISADERARVARVAELFSEEDLTRFLQIMLRTHSELGYRQEQRFHLELGLLKMVHAQRLLPVEQLLSQAGESAGAPSAVPAKPDAVRKNVASIPGSRLSPFEADVARKTENNPSRDEKSTPRGEATAESIGATYGRPVVTDVAVAEPPLESALEDIRRAVLMALENKNFRGAASVLEAGEWTLEAGEVLVRVSATPTIADMTLNSEAKRIAMEAASNSAGRALKLRVLALGTRDNGQNGPGALRQTANVRARAAEDPVVKRMEEKFGAQIRTVIDQREKR